MSEQGRQVLAEALKLPPSERAELVEELLDSFSGPGRKEIDESWGAEAEDRIDAYERGQVTSQPAAEVFARIDRGKGR